MAHFSSGSQSVFHIYIRLGDDHNEAIAKKQAQLSRAGSPVLVTEHVSQMSSAGKRPAALFIQVQALKKTNPCDEIIFRFFINYPEKAAA